MLKRCYFGDSRPRAGVEVSTTPKKLKFWVREWEFQASATKIQIELKKLFSRPIMTKFYKG